MERSYVLNNEEIVIRIPQECTFNADFGHCQFPLGEHCECSADWADKEGIDFPKCCPLKRKPESEVQMSLDYAGKWEQLLSFTHVSGYPAEELTARWHNWEPC